MEKQEFSALLSEITRRYSRYSELEKGDVRRALMGMSGLLEKTVIDYNGKDMKKAVEAFFEKKFKEGNTSISYNIDTFLRDPDARKSTRELTDFLYDTFNETINAKEVSKRTITILADISLQYIWDATEKGPRGNNQELVLAQNDTDNIKLFCEIANYFKSDYAEIILSKAAELLNLNDSLREGISYAIKLRNYFVPGDTLESRPLFLKIFGQDHLVKKSEDIQNNFSKNEFETIFGNLTDGDRPPRGILGYIETNRKRTNFMGSQGKLHTYMDELFSLR